MTAKREFWEGLSNGQKRRLNRFECYLCGQSLDRTLKYGCSALYCDPCTDKQSIDRAVDCLDHARKSALRVNL